jgi:phage minor structural protein
MEAIFILTIKDKSMNEIGILENAYNQSIERTVNQIWQFSFSLPKNDPKNDLCTHLNFIEVISPNGRNYGMYRIMPTQTKLSDESIMYKCEHVFATLLDNVMEGYHQFTNYTTQEVIQAILNMQETKHWVIGQIDFIRYFHYSFENENGLLAPILSIPKSFNEPYEFHFDTTVYPWKLNLLRSSDEVKAEIRWGKDMIDFNEVSDPTDIVNYIIPKGAGEGVNQLTIADVNGGKRYLKDDESISKWGKRSYIWIDKRFEDKQMLKENAQSLLNQWKNPKIAFTCKSADLSLLPGYEHERKVLNGVTNIIVGEKLYQARIIGESINDLAEEFNVNYEIANKLNDIATTTTDLERKQQVNEAYSQGATNIMTFGYQDNADNIIPAVIPFYVDDDVVNINTVELTFRTKKFRAYSQATKGGGAVVKSTSSGGGTTRSTSSGGNSTQTSSSGGGTSKSTESGGGSSQTSSSAAAHRHRMFSLDTAGVPNEDLVNYYGAYADAGGASYGLAKFYSNMSSIYTHSADGAHSHSVNVPNHSHSFTVPNHTHSVSIPSHTHDVTIPSHTHEIEIPDHTHEVEHKIVELNTVPNRVVIKVDGNTVPHTSNSGDRIDLVDYLEKDSSGKVTRGRHEVTITPNGLARIEADLILRVFIKSHLGGTY